MGRRAQKRRRQRRPVRARRFMVIKRWRYVVAYSVLLSIRIAAGAAVFFFIWWIF